jgi:hypothetical protein
MIIADTDMAPDLNVEGSGTMKIDLTTGLAESSTISLTANGTMENMGQVVNLNIISKTNSSQKQVK